MTYFKNSKTHLIGATGMVLLLLSAYFFGWQPYARQHQQFHSLKPDAENLLKVLPNLTKMNRGLVQQVAVIQENNATRVILEQTDLQLVSNLLQDRELKLVNFEEKSSQPGFTEVQFQTAGNYVNLMHLLADLHQLARPAKIVDLQLSAVSQDGQSCKAQMTVQFARELKQKLVSTQRLPPSSSS